MFETEKVYQPIFKSNRGYVLWESALLWKHKNHGQQGHQSQLKFYFLFDELIESILLLAIFASLWTLVVVVKKYFSLQVNKSQKPLQT